MREARSWERQGGRAGCGQPLKRDVSYLSKRRVMAMRTLRSAALAQEADHGLASEGACSVHCERDEVGLLVVV